MLPLILSRRALLRLGLQVDRGWSLRTRILLVPWRDSPTQTWHSLKSN